MSGFVFAPTVLTEQAANFGICPIGETHMGWPEGCVPDADAMKGDGGGSDAVLMDTTVVIQSPLGDPGGDGATDCDAGRCGVTGTGTGQPPVGTPSAIGAPSGTGIEGLPTGMAFLKAEAFGGIPWWVILLILFLIIVRRRGAK